MKKVQIQAIRSALIELDFLSQKDSDEMPDDVLKRKFFREDLALDSLDFILLLERLEGKDKLSLIDLDIRDCPTVQDLLNVRMKK